MAGYKKILFDIDDTLFDFDIDQKIAFMEAMNVIGYKCTEEMYFNYNLINLEMWEMLNEGKITLQELFIKRFELFFRKYGIKQNEKEFNEILTKSFQKTGTPIKGTKKVLEHLKDEYELIITSNGPKEQQYHRLENAGFSKYFSKVFISEELGCNKPNKEYFDIVFQNINNKEKSSILIVGDSISSDIIGGKNSGIATCWYNAKDKQNKTNVEPNYEIKDFIELLKII